MGKEGRQRQEPETGMAQGQFPKWTKAGIKGGVGTSCSSQTRENPWGSNMREWDKVGGREG